MPAHARCDRAELADDGVPLLFWHLLGRERETYTPRGVRSSVLKRSYSEYLFLFCLSICTTPRLGLRMKFVVFGVDRFYEFRELEVSISLLAFR